MSGPVQGLVRVAGPIVAVALLALAFIQAHNARQNATAIREVVTTGRDAQVKGCDRGNALRAQVNANIHVLSRFIQLAVDARRASGDKKIAGQYAALLPKLSPLDAVDCEAAYPPVPK